ncbi:MAG TPA: methyltransferase domain-containing protein [Rubrivivax sp.]|nr:methyltransferase domain-containing protein [Rubrivivax sp.]
MTEATASPTTRYTLGASQQEIERLDRQSASIENATRLLLRASGIRPGMRVLDLGSGLGAVAALVADLVGPQGRVVGIDNNANLLAIAAARFAGRAQLRFEPGDVTSWRDERPFDAIVGRLMLFHMANPLAVLQHHVSQLKPGGLLVVLDFDVGASRAEPPQPLAAQALGWVQAAFRSGGADPAMGTRLAMLLGQAGLAGVQGFGIQGYLAPDDPAGPALLSGVVNSLLPQIVASGVATAAQVDMATLQSRIAQEVRAARAVILPPVLAGAWGWRTEIGDLAPA